MESALPESAPRRLPYLLFALAVIGLEYGLAYFTDAFYPPRTVLVLILAFAAGRLAWPDGWLPNYGNVRASLRLTLKITLLYLAIMVVAGVVAVILIRANDWRFEIVTMNVRPNTVFWSWFWIAVIQAPLFEEIIYRGVLHPSLRMALGRWPAILAGGMVFWILHWFYAGGVTYPNHLLAGLLFAWVYDRTRSLLAPTLLHALGNLWLGLCDVVYLTWPEQVEWVLGWSA